MDCLAADVSTKIRFDGTPNAAHLPTLPRRKQRKPESFVVDFIEGPIDAQNQNHEHTAHVPTMLCVKPKMAGNTSCPWSPIIASKDWLGGGSHRLSASWSPLPSSPIGSHHASGTDTELANC